MRSSLPGSATIPPCDGYSLANSSRATDGAPRDRFFAAATPPAVTTAAPTARQQIMGSVLRIQIVFLQEFGPELLRRCRDRPLKTCITGHCMSSESPWHL